MIPSWLLFLFLDVAQGGLELSNNSSALASEVVVTTGHKPPCLALITVVLKKEKKPTSRSSHSPYLFVSLPQHLQTKICLFWTFHINKIIIKKKPFLSGFSAKYFQGSLVLQHA
jgi:hypothetical protein